MRLLRGSRRLRAVPVIAKGSVGARAAAACERAADDVAGSGGILTEVSITARRTHRWRLRDWGIPTADAARPGSAGVGGGCEASRYVSRWGGPGDGRSKAAAQSVEAVSKTIWELQTELRIAMLPAARGHPAHAAYPVE